MRLDYEMSRCPLSPPGSLSLGKLPGAPAPYQLVLERKDTTLTAH